MSARPSVRPAPATPTLRALFGLGVLVGLGACGGGPAASTGAAPGPTTASEAEWRAMATARPEAVEGSARVSVAEVQILKSAAWASERVVPAGLAVEELVAAGLLRRRDVRYVERRRFADAAAAERAGRTRPAGAPAAGVSPGPEFVVTAVWSSVGLDSAYLDVRLADALSGAVVGSWRGATANDADPVSLARYVVTGITSALDDLDRLPAWTDPLPAAAPAAWAPAAVPGGATEAFVRGLAAEERWDWEGARRGYQQAIAQGAGAFFEAEAALARAARLRTGGTLGSG